MAAREREQGAADAAERIAADLGGALLDVCGEGAPPALAAAVAARALVALRLRDYQTAERAAAVAVEAANRAIEASEAARLRTSRAEDALQEACALFGQASELLQSARDAGALVSYVAPADRGDAWEPPEEGHEDHGNEAKALGTRA